MTLKLRQLDQMEDFQAVYNVIMDGQDYAMIVNGEPPAQKDVANFFTDIAPGKTSNDMLKLGIEENGDFIGIVGIAQNFPENHIWHIGLLMLHSSRRNKGIGRYVIQRI
ncbi:MAG: GNAT family N-acetyltransferase, partial [Bradyrhizobium sp.]|nr:GNAT family N-acetyltransferase [Bradyrhizobium sp.]